MSAVSLTWRGRNSRLFSSWSLSPRYGRDGQEDHHCLPVHLHSHHHLANQHNQHLTNGPSSLVLDILPYLITGPVLQHGRQFALQSISSTAAHAPHHCLRISSNNFFNTICSLWCPPPPPPSLTTLTYKEGELNVFLFHFTATTTRIS